MYHWPFAGEAAAQTVSCTLRFMWREEGGMDRTPVGGTPQSAFALVAAPLHLGPSYAGLPLGVPTGTTPDSSALCRRNLCSHGYWWVSSPACDGLKECVLLCLHFRKDLNSAIRLTYHWLGIESRCSRHRAMLTSRKHCEISSAVAFSILFWYENYTGGESSFPF